MINCRIAVFIDNDWAFAVQNICLELRYTCVCVRVCACTPKSSLLICGLFTIHVFSCKQEGESVTLLQHGGESHSSTGLHLPAHLHMHVFVCHSLSRNRGSKHTILFPSSLALPVLKKYIKETFVENFFVLKFCFFPVNYWLPTWQLWTHL